MAAPIPAESMTPEPVETEGPLFVDADDSDVDGTDYETPATSAASMATEILSVSPGTIGESEQDSAADAVEDDDAEIISKDMTLIARGRKRRFRLR
jgi:hypothetical protein